MGNEGNSSQMPTRPIQFTEIPSMDWSVDDGLYNYFNTWKLKFNYIA